MSLTDQINFAPFNLPQPNTTPTPTTSTTPTTPTTSTTPTTPTTPTAPTTPTTSTTPTPTSMSNDISPRIESNVLNKNNIFSYSDYNTVMLANEANKLQHLNSMANNELLKTANSQRFFNLSLNDVVNNTVLTVVAIFVDLLQIKKKGNINYQDLAKIFISDDRMIYFGVFLIFLSLLFMVIFLSS
jgi:cyclophilin family peptidyl-prolyl cis-trans isomerase